MLQVASLLPWVFWSVYKFVIYPSKKNLMVAALVSALQVFAGHPQLTYLTWLLIGAYSLWFTFLKKNWIPAFAGMTLLLLLTFILSAIQVLPFLEFAGVSSRIGFGYAYATFDSLNPVNLIRFILPNIVGDLSRGTAWIQGGSVYGFAGALTLLFVLFAPLRKQTVKFFVFAGTISLIMAFGKYSPLYYLFYRIVPGLGSFRSPVHFLLIYTFCIALVAGFGMEEILRLKKYTSIKKILLAAGVAGLLSSVILVVLENNINPTNFHWLPGFLISKVQNVTELKEIILLVAENAFVLGVLAVICLLTLKKYIWVIPAAIFIELFLFASHGLLSVPYDRVLSWMAKSRQTAEKLKPLKSERIFVSRTLDFAPREKRFGLANYDQESAWQSLTLRTNFNIVYNLPTIDGYASMIYAPYAQFFAKSPADPTGIDVQKISNSTLRLLGVGKVEEGNNQAIMFRNLMTLGPVFIENNGRNTTNGILSSVWSTDMLRVKTNTAEPSNLVSLTVNYPGWQVFADGKPEVLDTYKDIFQKVTLPAGKHEVEFIYHPKSAIIGTFLTLIGFVIWLSLLVSAAIDRRKLRGNSMKTKAR